jgi:hypothetical protein
VIEDLAVEVLSTEKMLALVGEVFVETEVGETAVGEAER